MISRSSKHAVTKDPCVIRPATSADQAELLRLIRAYYRFDHIRFDARTIGPALAKLLDSRSLGRVWTVRDASKAVGYVVLTLNYDLEFGGLEGLVTDLFVHARYRGRGLGKRALEVVDEYCCRRGIGTIELQVEAANRNALEFYRRLGFKRLSRVVLTRLVRASRA